MAVHPVTNPMPGLYGPYLNAGAPSAGTDEVQTITIGGTPTGGTFTLALEGVKTAPIAWSATNATLVGNIDAALEALPNVGTGGVVTAVGAMTAGIGTITCTFSGGGRAKQALPVMTADASGLTGTAPTVTVARTTPGVNATARGAAQGASLIDTTNGVQYVNSTAGTAPTWGAV